MAKSLIKKAKTDKKDVHLSILELRNTPNAEGNSPAQKFMSRRTRTLLPITDQLLQPQVVHVQGIPSDIKLRKQKAKLQYKQPKIYLN